MKKLGQINVNKMYNKSNSSLAKNSEWKDNQRCNKCLSKSGGHRKQKRKVVDFKTINLEKHERKEEGKEGVGKIVALSIIENQPRLPFLFSQALGESTRWIAAHICFYRNFNILLFQSKE